MNAVTIAKFAGIFKEETSQRNLETGSIVRANEQRLQDLQKWVHAMTNELDKYNGVISANNLDVIKDVEPIADVALEDGAGNTHVPTSLEEIRPVEPHRFQMLNHVLEKTETCHWYIINYFFGFIFLTRCVPHISTSLLHGRLFEAVLTVLRFKDIWIIEMNAMESKLRVGNLAWLN